MDYTNDEGMIIFTADQSAVINWFANDINFNSDATNCGGSYGNVECFSCTDNIQNQDEQDVDCGGTICGDCTSYCGTDFFDPGGPSANYFLNQTNTWTFCPDVPTQTVNVTFTEWDVEAHNDCIWDKLTAFEGSNTSGNEIGSYCGTTSPGTISSPVAGECLTFEFISDNFVSGTGWKATISCSIALPVEFVSFTAENKNSNVLLKWLTVNEIDNKGFEIWKSDDGNHYENIGFVQGKNNSNQEHDYRFQDFRIVGNQTYYYKLKQVDYNGSFSHSDVVSVNAYSSTRDIKIYPNPLDDTNLNIEIFGYENQNLIFSIYDINGKEVYEEEFTNIRSSVLKNNFDRGVYFIKVSENDIIVKIEKLIKL